MCLRAREYSVSFGMCLVICWWPACRPVCCWLGCVYSYFSYKC